MPVPWKAKALLQRALSVTPQGHRLNYVLQRTVTHTLPRPDRVLDEVVATSRRHLDAVARYVPRPLAAVRFLEFGAGWDLAGALSLAALGARHQVVLDRTPVARAALVDGVVDRLVARGLLAGPPAPGGLDARLAGLGISYRAPGDARRTGLPPASIDVVTSTSVLEHVSPPDIVAILAELRRVLRPDGICSFAIDYHDHYASGSDAVHPLNFLRYDDRAWRRWNCSFQFQNRLRHPSTSSCSPMPGSRRWRSTRCPTSATAPCRRSAPGSRPGSTNRRFASPTDGSSCARPDRRPASPGRGTRILQRSPPRADDGGVRRLARPLLYAGYLGIVFGLARAHAVREGYDATGTSRFAWTVAYAALLCVAGYGAGLPDLPRTLRQRATSGVVAPLAAAVGISLVQLVVGDALLPRFVVFGSAAMAVPWSMLCAALAFGGRSRAEGRDRALVVADPGEAGTLVDELRRNPERPAVVAGRLSPDDARVAGDGRRPLVEEVDRTTANLVILDRAALADESVVHQAASLHERGVRVRTLSLFYEQWLGKLPVAELERVSLLFDIREVHGPRYVRIKRVLDIAAGLAGCVALAVVLPFVVVGNLAANRGPLLYRQTRVGKNGRHFTILKFRTMRPDDGRVDADWTARDDPRVTRFGRLLRRSHVDELPQVVNIVRGDLSVVGPRPEQPRYVDELRDKLPFYDLRHLVRPGLTGWAQVKYGYAGDERDALEKLQYEFWYLRHQSLAFDARIVGRTIRSILGGEGAGR